MHSDNPHISELVAAAQAGDPRARERLVADYLPLVYNIVGRALDGHADVDDVVQETMFRALHGLGGLREPASFRSWLVAIAMNQVRRRWTERQQAAATSLERVAEAPDPAGDFTELTIWRLKLSGQRRELAEATRWLDTGDRELLALWWQEAAGTLTRPELAEALGITAQHAAVRVKRMKTQLETGRVVVRALAARPRCPELAALLDPWDGTPAPVWRKRIARHARDCAPCGGHRSKLVPAEGLLVGLALVAPLGGFRIPSWASDPAAQATALTADPAADAAPLSSPLDGPESAALGSGAPDAAPLPSHLDGPAAPGSDARGPSDGGTAAAGSRAPDASPAAETSGSGDAPVAGGAAGRWRRPAAVGAAVLVCGLPLALL
ncbi:RNA polymerase sigma factor, partial [Streptomyces palmae]